jgi:hypothetical protein
MQNSGMGSGSDQNEIPRSHARSPDRGREAESGEEQGAGEAVLRRSGKPHQVRQRERGIHGSNQGTATRVGKLAP